MTQDELVKLKDATDNAIGVVKMDSKSLQCGEAVNWADLSCTQAAWVVTDTGENYAEVIIEEASPMAYLFQETIHKELEKRGWSNVLVVTEW